MGVKIEEVLLHLVEELDEIVDDLDENVGMDTVVDDLELDSLDVVHIQVSMKKKFGVEISAEMFSDMPNLKLGDICQKFVS